jgi:predicted secreted Zn-dependent protease
VGKIFALLSGRFLPVLGPERELAIVYAFMRIMALKQYRIFAFGLLCLLVFPGFFGPALAKVKTTEKTVFFAISGKDGEALNASMLEGGRERINLSHAVAATETEFDLGEPRTLVRNGKCTVQGIDVLLSIKYILPKWKTKTSAPQHVQRRWQAFWSELERHELHHGKIAKDAAAGLQRELDRLASGKSADCNRFGHLAVAKLDAAVRKASFEQNNFDRREYLAFSKISRLQINLLASR